MNTVWEALWGAYVDNQIDGVQALMPHDLDEPNEKLDEFIKNLGLSEHAEELKWIINDYTHLCERCGFMSGLKVGLMISQGLGVTI